MFTRQIIIACGAALLYSNALASGAQTDLGELSLEQLMQLPVEKISTVSRYEQKVNRAPASVTVVDSDDIARFGYRTLADILRSAAGMFVTYDRNYSYLGVRGFSRPGDFNTRVLILVDGHRINDALYGLAYIAQEAVLDVDMIDRVEIIRGPASSLYGNSAILGVINVITRRGKTIDGIEVGAEAGSFDSYKARAAFGKQLNDDLSVTLSGSYFDSPGHHDLYYPEFDDAATNNGHAIDSDSERASSFFGNVSYRDFSLSAGYSDRNKVVPTAPYGSVFNSRLFYTEDRRGYFDLKYEHSFARDLQILARTTYDWYPYRADFPYQNADPSLDAVINRDYARSEWARTEVQLTKHLSHEHVLVAGAEYQDGMRLRQKNYNVDPYENFTDATHRSQNYGAYAQGEFTLPAHFLLNAGMRYDHFESFGSTLDPRVALIYSPREKVTFKALFGRAFRAPSDYEINYQSRFQVSNRELQPEKLTTYELAYEQYLGSTTRISVSGYQYRIKNLISLVDSDQGLQIFENTDRARSRGVEFQLESRWSGGFAASASYSLQRSEDVSTGKEFGISPRHLVKAALSMPLYQQYLFGNLEAQYVSDAITVGRDTTAGYTLFNLTLLSRAWLRDTDISVSLYNLLDHTYRTPSADTGEQESILQDGRTFRVKLTYRPARK